MAKIFVKQMGKKQKNLIDLQFSKVIAECTDVINGTGSDIEWWKITDFSKFNYTIVHIFTTITIPCRCCHSFNKF